MSDPRADRASQRLRRLLPPPAPISGWGYLRTRVEGEAIGAWQDDQATAGENSMLLGALMARNDAAPSTWTNSEYTWTFSVGNEAGASGRWLDYWGLQLAVHREPSEADSAYASRIIKEIIRPTTTNIGMATAIDQGVGLTGTVVSEASTFFTIYRANEGYRANTSIRANNAPGLEDTPWSCFVVKLPNNPPAPYDFSTVERIANRSKAAGKRLIGVYLNETVSVIAPAGAAVTATLSATATGPTGSTWSWAITNGTILSGGTTSSITFRPTVPGPVTLTATATPPTGPPVSGTAVTQAYGVPNAAITVPEYVWAGQFDVVASIAAQPTGATITWSGVGIEIDGPTNQITFTFDAGASGGTTTIQAQVVSLGGTDLQTATLKVVPYTSTIAHTTASIPPATDNTNGYEDFSIDLGWQYQLKSMQTDYPAILRVYETAAARTADAGRALTASPSTDPTLQTAIVFEGQTSASLLSFALEHQVVGTNGDTPTRTKTAYCRLYNQDAVARAITVTLSRAELQVGPTF